LTAFLPGPDHLQQQHWGVGATSREQRRLTRGQPQLWWGAHARRRQQAPEDGRSRCMGDQV